MLSRLGLMLVFYQLSIIVSFSKVSGTARGRLNFGILERYMRLERNRVKATYVKNADTAVDSKRSRKVFVKLCETGTCEEGHS